MRLLFVFVSMVVLLTMPFGCASGGSQDDGSSTQAKLGDVTWQLVGVQGTPAADGRAAYFRLEPAQRVLGYSGVNQFSGGYELQGRSLKFGPLVMTRRAGPPELMRQEAAFSQALSNTVSWRAAGKDRIELLDASGKPLASFVAQGPG